MTQLSKNPKLEGLFGLATQEGVDVRPTLLRVATDLYVLTKQHSREEEQDYINLALPLLDVADTRTRVAVAAALATYPAAPRAVMLRLARDYLIVADPVLRHATCLTSEDFAAIAAERGAGHAASIARRGPIERVGVERYMQSLRENATPAAPRPQPPLPVVDAAPSVAPAQAPPGAAASDDASELFFSADSDARRLILTNLEALSPAKALPSPAESAAAVKRIESAALAHQPNRIAWEIEKALRLPARQARRIVEDRNGEPIVVALKALNAPSALAQRVLLFVNTEIGHSVGRVHDLAALYDALTQELAMRLVSVWRGSVRPVAGLHRPLQEADGARDTRSQPRTGRPAARDMAQPGAMSRK